MEKQISINDIINKANHSRLNIFVGLCPEQLRLIAENLTNKISLVYDTQTFFVDCCKNKFDISKVNKEIVFWLFPEFCFLNFSVEKVYDHIVSLLNKYQTILFIFIHNYFIVKYLDIMHSKNKLNDIMYYFVTAKTDNDSECVIYCSDDFYANANSLIDEFTKLYKLDWAYD